MSLTLCILFAVALQRLAELLYSKRNTKKLLAEGGKEVGQSHYPVMIAIHTGWLFTITTFVVLADTHSVDDLIIWPLIGVYGLVQVGRFWVLYSLGRYWSTKVIDLPEAEKTAAGTRNGKGPFQAIHALTTFHKTAA